MFQNIKYINNIGEIEFSNKSPIILQSISGLGDVKVNNTSTKFVNSDGEKYENSTLDKGEIIIKYAIVAKSIEEYMDIRDRMLKVINPKLGESTLEYRYVGKERTIKVVPDNTPSMPIKSNKKITECEIVLLAHDPYMKDIYETGEEISTWIGGMPFKFSLPFSLKKRGSTKKNIYNDGHVETPVKIYFKGPAVNPKVINNTTGEFIQVIRELTADDTLIINTEFGNKTVEIVRNGVSTNAFHYIDLDSEFFNLQVGDNLIEYSSDNEINPQSVEIRYKNRYVGV